MLSQELLTSTTPGRHLLLPNQQLSLRAALWRRGARARHVIVTACRIPIRPHPKPIRIQNSERCAFLTTVRAPRFPIQRRFG